MAGGIEERGRGRYEGRVKRLIRGAKCIILSLCVFVSLFTQFTVVSLTRVTHDQQVYNKLTIITFNK